MVTGSKLSEKKDYLYQKKNSFLNSLRFFKRDDVEITDNSIKIFPNKNTEVIIHNLDRDIRDILSELIFNLGLKLEPDYETKNKIFIKKDDFVKYFRDNWWASNGEKEIMSFNGIDWFQIIRIDETIK